MTQASLDETCRTVYSETKTFYAEVAQACGNLGFKILYGPPVYEAPIFFVAQQPGGGSKDCARELASGAHDRWPPVCEYATESWTLAKQMRSMFGEALLRQCVGLNAIFIRAPSAAEYRKNVDYISRGQIEAFCLPRVLKIVNAVQPRHIVLIGFETLNQFGGGTPELQNDKGRVLTKVGKIAGRPALATLHLNGAQISNVDRARIRDRVLAT
jgi:hypothetical protein